MTLVYELWRKASSVQKNLRSANSLVLILAKATSLEGPHLYMPIATTKFCRSPECERVFKEEFTPAKVQRCQVHVAGNVLANVPVERLFA